MAPHSSTLAWKITWTEEPGRLQSMGSRRVGHDWATSLSRIGEGNGNPLQCSCLENPRDGVALSWTQLKWLSSSNESIWYNQGYFLPAVVKSSGPRTKIIPPVSTGALVPPPLCSGSGGAICLHWQLDIGYWLAKLTLLRINPQRGRLELNVDVCTFHLCLEK